METNIANEADAREAVRNGIRRDRPAARRVLFIARSGMPRAVEQQALFDYPHARVRLHFCKVFEWTGEFEMREPQLMPSPSGMSTVCNNALCGEGKGSATNGA